MDETTKHEEIKNLKNIFMERLFILVFQTFPVANLVNIANYPKTIVIPSSTSDS